MKRKIFSGLIALAIPLVGAEAEIQKVEEARRIVAEYEMSERIRAIVALSKAKEVVEGYERGKSDASAEQLAAAREIIRQDEEQKATDRLRAIEATPVLVILYRDSRLNLEKLIDAANRQFMETRIAEIKRFLDDGHENERLRQELSAWEKALIELKPTGKILGGTAVTIFEEADCFTVAYFDGSRMEHFAHSFSKEGFIPLSGRERRAFNTSQKEVIYD